MGSLFDEELAVADSNGFWFRCPLPGCPWKKIPGELMDFPSGNHQVNRDGCSIARYYYYQC
jgi:hypothetical protein